VHLRSTFFRVRARAPSHWQRAARFPFFLPLQEQITRKALSKHTCAEFSFFSERTFFLTKDPSIFLLSFGNWMPYEDQGLADYPETGDRSFSG